MPEIPDEETTHESKKRSASASLLDEPTIAENNKRIKK
jgi:hypothetical protein